MNAPSYKSGVLLVLVAGILWSFQALIIRQIEDAGPWTILFWRSLSMAVVLLVFLGIKSGLSPIRAIRDAGLAGIIGGAGLVLAMGGAVLAFQTTTVANAAFLFAASPFLAAALGWIVLREIVSRRTVISIAIALVGIFIMVSDGLAGGAWIGNAAALTSAFGFATFTVALRWRAVENSLPLTFLGGVFAVMASLAAIALSGDTFVMSPLNIFWCVLMGSVTLAGGMILYTFGSKAVLAAELTLLSTIEVLLAPIWVWLLLGETGSIGTLLGGAILLAAILYNALAGARARALA